MKFLRLMPGHGELVLAEGDPDLREDEQQLLAAFREQLELGMWAAVPTTAPNGSRRGQMVTAFEQVPRDADRVIFFPRAAGG